MKVFLCTYYESLGCDGVVEMSYIAVAPTSADALKMAILEYKDAFICPLQDILWNVTEIDTTVQKGFRA